MSGEPAAYWANPSTGSGLPSYGPGTARLSRRSLNTSVRWIGRPSVVGGLALLLGWQLLHLWRGGGVSGVPAPFTVVRQIVRDASLYRLDAPPTLTAAGAGFVLGNASAIVIGIVVSGWGAGRRQVMSVVVTLYNIPVLAVAPLLQILLSSQGPSIAMAAMSVFFVTLLGTVAGLAAADPAMVDIVRAYGGGPVTVFRRVRLRYAMPSVLAGLAVSAPFALVGAMVGEFLGGRSTGLGVLLVQSLSDLNVSREWGLCLVISTIGAACISLANYASRRLFPWGSTWTGTTLPAATRSLTPLRRAVRGIVNASTVLTIVLVIWVAAIKALRVPPFVARMPWDVWRYLFTVADASHHRSQLAGALVVTLSRALGGCALGMAVGISLAVAMSQSALLRAALMPPITLLNSTPQLALVPVLALALGRGLVLTLTLAALIAMLPTIVNVESGINATATQFLDVVRAAGGSRSQVWRKVIGPAILPQCFLALRISAPWAVLGVLYAEWLATGGGVGDLMVQQAVNGNYGGAWATAVAVSGACVTLYLLAEVAERSVLRRFSAQFPPEAG
ncbi:MAG: ABC transporter permease [Frankia sp.]